MFPNEEAQMAIHQLTVTPKICLNTNNHNFGEISSKSQCTLPIKGKHIDHKVVVVKSKQVVTKTTTPATKSNGMR